MNPTPRKPATLHACGRLPWSELLSLIGDAPTAWADYHGFHIGAAPTQPPPYTHLWAWQPGGQSGWLLRARIDGAHAIVGVLQIGDDRPAGLAAHTPEAVRYTKRTSHTWLGTEKRVGRLHPDVVDRGVQLYEVDGESPVTFVSLDAR
jgi:hypothetical protein